MVFPEMRSLDTVRAVTRHRIDLAPGDGPKVRDRLATTHPSGVTTTSADPRDRTGRVLVLGSDTHAFLAVIRSLGRHGLDSPPPKTWSASTWRWVGHAF